MSNPNPQDPFEMFRRLWGPLGLPVPGMAMPTLDPTEIDKRIADLKSIEGWLTMNLNMLKLSIQGLEMQKLTLSAMQASLAARASPGQPNAFTDLSSGAGAAASNMLWPWTMVQQVIAEQLAAQGGSAVNEAASASGGKPPDSSAR